MTSLYHTAPTEHRENICRVGLLAHTPTADDWHGVEGQRHGVYLEAQPDVLGVWSRDGEWDVWLVDPAGLPTASDPLNPPGVVVTEDIHPSRCMHLLTLHGPHRLVRADAS